MPNDSTNASTEVLNSWKEIAAYLNRGVRTVQRWETALHLPVRRPRGKQRSAVFAMRSDIDQWLRSCPLQGTAQNAPNGAPAPALEPMLNLKPSNQELLLASRALRADLNRSQVQMSVSIKKLISTLGRMMEQGERVA